MRTLALAFKLAGYALLVAVTYPLAWWLRPADYDGEVFAEYDDDDIGTDVDGEL
jgi:hypothetical protein